MQDDIFEKSTWFVVLVLIALIVYAIYYGLTHVDSLPSLEEIQNLENALPDGCVSHDVGSYGKIDNLLIIECSDRKVSTAYTYMKETHGKSTEIDRAAAFVIQ